MKEFLFWSRLPAFYALNIENRRERLFGLPINLNTKDFKSIDAGLSLAQANLMTENVIATFDLPLSLATNFIINNKPLLVPMVTEEPSVVAACSKMAKTVSETGGFIASADEQLLSGQLQILDLPDLNKAQEVFLKHRPYFINLLNENCIAMCKRGGGVKDINFRVLSSPKTGAMLILEPLVDVKDAMGANMVNTLMEILAKEAHKVFGGQIGLAILSNYCDQRLARSYCKIPISFLSDIITKKMIAAHALAEIDIYRATTHNKGIMNGIDAVAIATGNDFRAIEASAHAYAYTKQNSLVLSDFKLDATNTYLEASIELPIAVGVIGGNRGFHKTVDFAHKILGEFSDTNKNLACVMASVGLAQCLAAVFALCSDGIQKGHMKLHEKKIIQKGV
jgi:hydroxymethylglutaryl-CoA reductase